MRVLYDIQEEKIMSGKKFAITDTLSGKDIKLLRGQLQLTQAEFAGIANVSKKTIERWETSDKPITGPIVTLVRIMEENSWISRALEIPEQFFPMRLWYMYKTEVCTILDVDERNRELTVYNYKKNPMFRAFGREEHPTYEQYEEFLESRCFPRTRDKMKLQLKELNLPFYDPMLIIEKTQGRMAEDDFWIKIERGEK